MKVGFYIQIFHKDSNSVPIEWFGISVQHFVYVKIFLNEMCNKISFLQEQRHLETFQRDTYNEPFLALRHRKTIQAIPKLFIYSYVQVKLFSFLL